MPLSIYVVGFVFGLDYNKIAYNNDINKLRNI